MAVGTNNIKVNPESLDVWIQKMQTTIFDGLAFDEFDAYGRVYLVEKDGNKIPAHFLQNKDYAEVLTDDLRNGHFFFLEGGESTPTGTYHIETPIEVIFFLNVAKLLPLIVHRADIEIRKMIHIELAKCHYFTLDKILIDEVAVSGFDIKPTYMQPYHIVNFQGKINYQYNC